MNGTNWRGWGYLMMAGFLGANVGCQTWFPEAGLTLPTGEYLKHQPQYIPQTPPFPLPREQSGLEAATARQVGGVFPAQPGGGQP